MLKALLLLGGSAAAGAAALRSARVRALAGRLGGHRTEDPTIAGFPEPRMPVQAQATITPKLFAPGEHPEEDAAEGRGPDEGRGPSGEARG
jgi:hypothetical protein